MKKIYFIFVVFLTQFNAPVFAQDADELSPFVENVVTHVLLHEVAHALIREFNLPVLGNEETMADGFATHYITQNMRDDAVQIVTARAQSWIYEDSQVKPKNYDMKGEHELDIRRAYNVMCWLYGADPADWSNAVEWVDFSEHDLNDCSDSTPQQIDSWAQVLAPHMHPTGQSENVELIIGEGTYESAMKNSDVLNKIIKMMRKFNWPNAAKLHFDHCSEGASWSRDNRTISLCDKYVSRFIEQEEHIQVR